MRCIFDSMPSRTIITRPSLLRPSEISNQTRQLSIRPSTKPSTPTTQLALRSRLHTTAAKKAEVESFRPIENAEIPPTLLSQSPAPAVVESTFSVEAPITTESQPLVLSKSIQSLLPALQMQKPHYITAHIHRFPYLLTEGDTLRLPFHMHGVSAGDVLRFNRATIIGSRDYTLKAGFQDPQHSSPPHVRGEQFTNKKRTNEPNYIDERLFECRMRVMGVDSSPMMIKEKKKRRIRRTKTVMSKHKYTVLKVMEVRVKTLDELMQTGDQVVLE